MSLSSTRRRFLQTAPLATAALATGPLAAAQQPAAQPAALEHFRLLTAGQLADAIARLKTTPGNDTLFAAPSLPFSIVLTTEVAKAAKEYEWHEGRDHIIQIVDGSTVYDLGGAPQGGRNTKPAEWLAPASDGATRLTLRKGDMLVIPRGTPHKRTTAESVTFYLISTSGHA